MKNILPITDFELSSAQREVEALHAFFAWWYNGAVVNTEEAFARFADVMDDGFHMITPDADVFDRSSVLTLVRDGWGQFENEDGFAIEIRNFRVMGRLSAETLLVLYEEWQSEPGRMDEEGRVTYRGRLSSAGLRADAGAVNGWRWLFVHEVWLPE